MECKHKKLPQWLECDFRFKCACYSPKPVENVEKLHTFEEK